MEPAKSPASTKPNGTTTTAEKRNVDISRTQKRPPSLIPKLDTIQLIILAIYPTTVLLGMVSNHPVDSYFAQKDNLINVYFLKYGWLWTSLAFFAHISQMTQVTGPLARYLVATIWWYLVTQWCFGPPIMDMVFRGTGGMCEIAKEEDFPSILTSAICKSSGGAWNGGHDLSGHIFLLTHASLFIWWEILDHVSSPNFTRATPAKIIFALLVVWWFSMLNSATYFHTNFEKVTGLLAGLIGWYLTQVVAAFGLESLGIHS